MRLERRAIVVGNVCGDGRLEVEPFLALPGAFGRSIRRGIFAGSNTEAAGFGAPAPVGACCAIEGALCDVSAACWLLTARSAVGLRDCCCRSGRRRGLLLAPWRRCDPLSWPTWSAAGRTLSTAPGGLGSSIGAFPGKSHGLGFSFWALALPSFGCVDLVGAHELGLDRRSHAGDCRGVLSITANTSATWPTAERKAPERIRDFRSGGACAQVPGQVRARRRGTSGGRRRTRGSDRAAGRTRLRFTWARRLAPHLCHRLVALTGRACSGAGAAAAGCSGGSAPSGGTGRNAAARGGAGGDGAGSSARQRAAARAAAARRPAGAGADGAGMRRRGRHWRRLRRGFAGSAGRTATAGRRCVRRRAEVPPPLSARLRYRREEPVGRGRRQQQRRERAGAGHDRRHDRNRAGPEPLVRSPMQITVAAKGHARRQHCGAPAPWRRLGPAKRCSRVFARDTARDRHATRAVHTGAVPICGCATRNASRAPGGTTTPENVMRS